MYDKCQNILCVNIKPMNMNLGDPELELIDPTPNVYNLFINFDMLFFWSKLASRAVVRWSKRMYSCAGICSYEGRGGLCDIALSEPLLKLRPRKDLVETLLHEMIHAFLFVTCRDQDRNGHGPNFQSHMHRINKVAGLNISIYHDFHDEVKLYQTHWWRCNGPCQTKKPYFGIIRRTANRAPGPNDEWWKRHQSTCGGTFIKIKEPENSGSKKQSKITPKADITKFINNNNDVINKNIPPQPKNKPKNILKDSNKGIVVNGNVKNNNVISINQKTKNNIPSAKVNKNNDKGHINSNKKIPPSSDVVETVRNIWANKQLNNIQNVMTNISKNTKSRTRTNTEVININKHKSRDFSTSPPPNKIKKIDDYFKKVATSVLKDIYGEDITITQSKTDDKLIATKVNLVSCPICNVKVKDEEINRHVDECLNKGVIDKLCKDGKSIEIVPTVISSNREDKAKVQNKAAIPVHFSQGDNGEHSKSKTKRYVDSIDLINTKYIKKEASRNTNSIVYGTADSQNNASDKKDLNKVKLISKKINLENHLQKSGNFKKEADIDLGYLPSFLNNLASEIKSPSIKIEPGCSKDANSAFTEQKCPCCGDIIRKPIAEHLDECLSFFENNTTIPEEGTSTSFANETIVIDDDDDIFDETQTLNATGTKYPCPCCLQMVEQVDMNNHLDQCLSS